MEAETTQYFIQNQSESEGNYIILLYSMKQYFRTAFF